MNSSEERHQNPYEGRFGLGAWILLLALAVFGWGLHSKLSLYHVQPHSPLKTQTAKLLSERERMADHMETAAATQPEWTVAKAWPVILLLPSTVPSAPRREDPPLFACRRVIHGPSFLRPPPSLIA